MQKKSNVFELNFEELCENVFTRCNTLGHLSDIQRENNSSKKIDEILAKRKTPMPAKITVAGAKTYKTFIIDLDLRFETYQADAPRDSRGKCVKNVHSWSQPFCQSLIVTTRFVEFSDLILKDRKNGAS